MYKRQDIESDTLTRGMTVKDLSESLIGVADAQEEDSGSLWLRRLKLVFGEDIETGLDAATVSRQDILRSASQSMAGSRVIGEEICFASGRSDCPSICEHDTGPKGSIPWWIRPPYFYMRMLRFGDLTDHPERRQTFRRKVYPRIAVGTLEWDFEHPEDNAGLVTTSGFSVPTGYAPTKDGGLVLLHAERGYTTDGATMEGPRLDYRSEADRDISMIEEVVPDRLPRPELTLEFATKWIKALVGRFQDHPIVKYVSGEAPTKGKKNRPTHNDIRRALSDEPDAIKIANECLEDAACLMSNGAAVLKEYRTIAESLDGGGIASLWRDLECIYCKDPLGPLIEQPFTACELCGELVHTCYTCSSEHMRTHVRDEFMAGCRVRRDNDEKYRKARALETTCRTLKGGAEGPELTLGVLPADPKGPGMDPDLLLDFWKERPELDDAALGALRNCFPDRDRDRIVRCESSDEDEPHKGLPKVGFCSGCGSFACRMDPVRCRKMKKSERLRELLDLITPRNLKPNMELPASDLAHLFLGLLDTAYLANAKRAHEREMDKRKIRQEICERKYSVTDSDGMTSSVHAPAAARWRKLVEVIDKSKGNPDSQLHRAVNYAGNVPGDMAVQEIIRSQCNIGRQHHEIKELDRVVAHGRRFTESSASAALCHSAAEVFLNRAAVASISEDPSRRRRSAEFVERFLRRGSTQAVRDALVHGRKFLAMCLSSKVPNDGEPIGDRYEVSRVTTVLEDVAETMEEAIAQQFFCRKILRRSDPDGATVRIRAMTERDLRRAFEHRQKVAAKKKAARVQGMAKASAEAVAAGAGSGVGHLPNAENRAAAAAAAESEQLPATLEERVTLTGDELAVVVAAEKRRRQELTEDQLTELSKMYDPGTWLCSRCGKCLAEKVWACDGYFRENKDSPWKPCKGDMDSTFKCWVSDPECRPSGAGPGRSSAGRSSERKRRSDGRETDSDGGLTEAALQARAGRPPKEKLDEAGRRAKHRDEALADPKYWECQYCHQPDGSDTLNASYRYNCWSCQRNTPRYGERRKHDVRNPADWNSLWAYRRWKCPGCQFPERPLENISNSGMSTVCRICQKPWEKNFHTYWVNFYGSDGPEGVEPPSLLPEGQRPGRTPGTDDSGGEWSGKKARRGGKRARTRGSRRSEGIVSGTESEIVSRASSADSRQRPPLKGWQQQWVSFDKEQRGRAGPAMPSAASSDAAAPEVSPTVTDFSVGPDDARNDQSVGLTLPLPLRSVGSTIDEREEFGSPRSHRSNDSGADPSGLEPGLEPYELAGVQLRATAHRVLLKELGEPIPPCTDIHIEPNKKGRDGLWDWFQMPFGRRSRGGPPPSPAPCSRTKRPPASQRNSSNEPQGLGPCSSRPPSVPVLKNDGSTSGSSASRRTRRRSGSPDDLGDETQPTGVPYTVFPPSSEPVFDNDRKKETMEKASEGLGTKVPSDPSPFAQIALTSRPVLFLLSAFSIWYTGGMKAISIAWQEMAETIETGGEETRLVIWSTSRAYQALLLFGVAGVVWTAHHLLRLYRRFCEAFVAQKMSRFCCCRRFLPKRHAGDDEWIKQLGDAAADRPASTSERSRDGDPPRGRSLPRTEVTVPPLPKFDWMRRDSVTDMISGSNAARELASTLRLESCGYEVYPNHACKTWVWNVPSAQSSNKQGYYVRLKDDKESWTGVALAFSCTCPHFRTLNVRGEQKGCKHIGAVCYKLCDEKTVGGLKSFGPFANACGLRRRNRVPSLERRDPS